MTDSTKKRRDAAHNSSRQLDSTNASAPDRFQAASYKKAKKRRDATHDSSRQFDSTNASAPDRFQAAYYKAKKRRDAAHDSSRQLDSTNASASDRFRAVSYKAKSFFDIKFWKFILVGIINTLVGNGLQFVFYACFGWDKFYWGVWLASLLGYFFGSVVSYFLNKYFTFKNKETGWKPIAKFALNIAVCYGLAYGIAIPVTKWICLAGSFTIFGLNVEVFADYCSMIIGSCLFVAFNYIGQRFFAFREKN